MVWGELVFFQCIHKKLFKNKVFNKVVKCGKKWEFVFNFTAQEKHHNQ